jgi:tellurite resistance protein TerC
MISISVWIIFIALVAVLMAVDLGVFNKKDHVPSAKEALGFTLMWVALALAFGAFLWVAYDRNWGGLGTYLYEPMDGRAAVLKYITGYLLEQSLSIDNLFVIALVFTRFRIPKVYQHRVLFWGIIGVIVFRGILIGVGIELVHHFQWLFYVFGALLIYSAIKMLRHNDDPADEDDFDQKRIVKTLRRFFPVSGKFDNGHFFTLNEAGRWAMTPLFVALIVVELTDVLFAFDSVPAVFSITTDPFLVFSSNIFAILGLRSLYFVLSDILDRFENLRYSLVAILFFIGIKMLLIPTGLHIDELLSLGVIALLLVIGVTTSIFKRR